MKTLKFYAWALLMGATAFTFQACGDKDDDNDKSSSSNNDSIVGTWISNENGSSYSVNSKTLKAGELNIDPSNFNIDELINETIENMISDSTLKGMLDIVGDTIVFTADNKFFSMGEEGTYSVSGDQLTMTKTLETGSEVTIKTGADITDMLFEENADLKDYKDATTVKVNSLTYNCNGNSLKINIDMSISIGIAKISPEFAALAGSSDYIMPLKANIAYTRIAE